MHFSRIMPPVGGHRYSPSTAVLLSEIIKLSVSLTMALYDISTIDPSSPATVLFRRLRSAVFSGDSWKLVIPAMLYTLSNSLQYIAVGNLDASTVQITYQMKMLTTAIFSVIFLRKRISAQQLLALLLLTIGVITVQMRSGPDSMSFAVLREGSGLSYWFPRSIEQLKSLGSKTAAQLSKRSATYQGIEKDHALMNLQFNPWIGLIAVAITCISSGLAGVYLEKVLKHNNVGQSSVSGQINASLWVRNVQLSFYSLFPALVIGVIFLDGKKVTRTGFFAGYNWVVWTSVAMQAMGGILVALITNYADNISKNFGTSVSIIITFFGSVFMFDLPATFTVCTSKYLWFASPNRSQYILGTLIVLLSTWLYYTQQGSRLPTLVVADYEKFSGSHDKGYFDDIESMNVPRSPMMRGREGFTTSRPGTPSHDRHHFRASSARRQFENRDG